VDISARLGAIDAAIAKLAEKGEKTDYTPAELALIGSLVGVFIGALVTIWTQRKLLANQQTLAQGAATNAKTLADDKAKQERQLAERRADLEIGAAIVQWRLKQLSELYGPLYALFRQSHALYRHMNIVLAKAKPQEFRLSADVGGDDFDGKLFEIRLNGQWTRFRTVMHLAQVYGRGYGIEDYFNQVVAIGGRIVKVIQEKAGFVRPEQVDLATVFGRYLAHYTVLERLHAHLKAKYDAASTGGDLGAGAQQTPMNVDESAVFPSEIQKLVDAGFEAIRRELIEWGAKV
jgi:hypothetical protein